MDSRRTGYRFIERDGTRFFQGACHPASVFHREDRAAQGIIFPVRQGEVRARRDIIQYFDDLDDTLLQEEDLQVVRLSVAGTDYLLDLSEDTASQLRRVLEPYIHAAHQVPSTTNKIRERTGGGSTSREIRQWAQDQGMKVSSRGKIPHKIVDAYTTAHTGSRKK